MTFLAGYGFDEPSISLLASDASFRSYWRIRQPHRNPTVLMDAPPPMEDVGTFARVDRHLSKLGFSVPEILGCDLDDGLMLLEDFGDDTFSRLLNAGAEEAPLYATAVDLLATLHSLPADEAIALSVPQYDIAMLTEEAMLLVDWYLPAIHSVRPLPSVREAYAAAWDSVLDLPLAMPTTLALRDFHVDNLMRLPGRTGIAQCGLLDFQDAVAGPTGYDLMSLLEDARRDIPPALKTAMLERYLAAVDVADADDFHRAFAILAAQRHAKVIGIFTRLAHRDGKPTYLKHIPRVWRMLEYALGNPSLAPVAKWFERHLPAGSRPTPPAIPAFHFGECQ